MWYWINTNFEWLVGLLVPVLLCGSLTDWSWSWSSMTFFSRFKRHSTNADTHLRQIEWDRRAGLMLSFDRFKDSKTRSSKYSISAGVQITLKSNFFGGRPFRINHPFIGYIYDNQTKTTLFSTLVSNPTMVSSEIKSIAEHHGGSNGANIQLIPTICATAAMFLLAQAL